MAKTTSNAAAISAVFQIGQGLYSNYLARAMEGDRSDASAAGAALANQARDSRNAAVGATSSLQRWLQAERNKRAIKNQEALFGQAQEAIAATSRGRIDQDLQAQIMGSRDSGANAARSAAAGVVGDGTVVELTQALATARSRAQIAEQAAQQTDDLTIRSSRALAGTPVAGDLSVLLPGLDRRFNLRAASRGLPNAWQTLLGGVAALPPDQLTNLVQTAAPAAQGAWDYLKGEYSFRFADKADDRFLADDGREDGTLPTGE